jgi:hypothetical protein
MGEEHDNSGGSGVPPPGNNVPPDHLNHEAELAAEANELMPDWTTGFYIGTAQLNRSLHFIFIRSKTNDERRSLDDGEHSTPFAIPCVSDEAPPFAVGLPYWFRTAGEQISSAPDGVPVYAITNLQEIVPFRPGTGSDSPVIRCTILGTRGIKFIRCSARETHRFRLSSPPVFQIYKDLHPAAPDGDYVIKIFAAASERGLYPCVERSSGVSATLFRGKAPTLVLRDVPPVEFVLDICRVMKAYLIIGSCEELPSIPSITLNDIVRVGCFDGLSTYDQATKVITDTLRVKYLESEAPDLQKTDENWIKKVKRAKIIVHEGRIKAHSGFCTLLWPGCNDAFHLGSAVCYRERNFAPSSPLLATEYPNSRSVTVSSTATLPSSPLTFSRR